MGHNILKDWVSLGLRYRLVLPLTLVTALAACVSTGDKSQAHSMPAEQGLSASAPLQNDLYYQLLVAEMAGQDENFEFAATAYKKALQLAQQQGVSDEDQYRIARRAWNVGRFTENTELADFAAQIWQAHHDDNNARLARIIAVETAPAERQQTVLTEVLALEFEPRGQFLGRFLQHYRDSNEGDLGLKMIDGWLDSHAEDAQMLYVGAVLAEERQSYAMAYQWWMRYADLAEADAAQFEAKAKAAVNLREMGAPAEAVDMLQALVNERPQNQSLQVELARAFMANRQPEAGLALLKPLVKGVSGSVELQFLTGYAAYFSKQYLLATEYFERALKKGYDNHEARFWLGLAQLRAGNAEQSLHWLSSVGQGPRERRADYLMGDALAKLADWEKFAEHYQRLHQVAPDEASQHFLAQGRSLIDVKDYDKASGFISKALALAPDDVEILYQHGVIYSHLGQYETAAESLRKVVAAEPENAEALNALGYMLIDGLANTDEGLPLVKRALALNPDSAPIMDSYGWGLLLAGDLQQALFWLDKAWQQLKDHEIGAHLGEALWLSDQPKQARDIWRQAQALPKHEREDKVLQAYERLGIEAD